MLGWKWPSDWVSSLSPLLFHSWLHSLEQKHSYLVLARPVRVMGGRGGSSIHLVVIDYGHLVRQQLFCIMSDHKLSPKAVSVKGCACTGEQERGCLRWQLSAQGRGCILPAPAAACVRRFPTVLPSGAQCEVQSGWASPSVHHQSCQQLSSCCLPWGLPWPKASPSQKSLSSFFPAEVVCFDF